MDNGEDDGSIEEIGLERKTVFGNKSNIADIDLMRAIIIHIRIRKMIRDSSNKLIFMLEKLLSQINVEEKKHILTKEYGMIMTTNMEGRLQTMCNLSEIIIEEGLRKGIEEGIERGIEKGIEEGIEKGIAKGIEKERMAAIGRILQAGATKEQILSYGYTEKEFIEAERVCGVL